MVPVVSYKWTQSNEKILVTWATTDDTDTSLQSRQSILRSNTQSKDIDDGYTLYVKNENQRVAADGLFLNGKTEDTI